MKPDFPPTPPSSDDDDGAADPLLAALRKQLGAYGQAPPPRAWAAIRQQLAPPPARRSGWGARRLAGLLALLVGLLGAALLVKQQVRPANRTAAGLAPARPAPSPGVASRSGLPAPGAASGQAAARGPKASASAAAPNGARAVAPAADAATRASAAAGPAGTPRAAEPRLPGRPALVPASEPARGFAAAGKRRRYQSAAAPVAQAERRARTSQPVLTAALPVARRTATTAGKAPPYPTEASTGATHPAATRPRSVAHRLRQRAAANQLTSEMASPAPGRLVAGASAALAGGLPAPRLDSLAGRPAVLLLPAPMPPAAPAARPDSSKPRLLVRRWSVLVVGGPTLSYRTLGPAPARAAGHPDFARLERPALGLGAQVQVRRVLVGRWGLAAGLGYHEYATQLALAIKDSAYSVHQRDTYRVLTVPVQLSYALGAPTGRLTTALLLGAEPGWYLGGRSTEGADCGCHPQEYSSANSPYRPWTLAFSLGLDLRWQLGGAGSRWRWVVQPTGRYVATPFVKSTAVGFTPRQPFSLGVLTGFSWEVR